MKSKTKILERNSSPLPRQKGSLSMPQSAVEERSSVTPLQLLESLQTANRKNLVSCIAYFVQQVKAQQPLFQKMADSRLDPLWYELLIQHSHILADSKLCPRSVLPLPQKTHSLFQQLMGLYLYVTASQRKIQDIDLYRQPAFYGNITAAKALTQYYIEGITQSSLSLELSALKAVADELEENFSSLQSVGCLLLGFLLVAIGSRFIRETSEESKIDGWSSLGRAIMFFYVADKLKSTPNSIAFLQNAYGAKTFDEMWKSSDSPLYFTGGSYATYPTYKDYIDKLHRLYKKNGRSLTLLETQAGKISEKVLKDLSQVTLTVIPKKTLSEHDLLLLVESIFPSSTSLATPSSWLSRPPAYHEKISDSGKKDNESVSDEESHSFFSDAKTDSRFSSDDSLFTPKHSSSGGSSKISSRTASPDFFSRPKSPSDHAIISLDKKPQPEEPKSSIPTITLSQYKKLTGLSVVVSSNFGRVVPDEPRTPGSPKSR